MLKLDQGVFLAQLFCCHSAMKKLKLILGLLPCFMLTVALSACSDAENSSSPVSSDSSSMTTSPIGSPENPDQNASDSMIGTSNPGHSTSGAEARTDNHSSTKETSNRDVEVGPNATTVLQGQKEGNPEGSSKSAHPKHRDSINNRTGLAPPF